MKIGHKTNKSWPINDKNYLSNDVACIDKFDMTIIYF